MGWVSGPVAAILTEPSCLLVSIIILQCFHTNIQLNTPYPATLFSYMQNSICNATLQALFKINHYCKLTKKSGLKVKQSLYRPGQALKVPGGWGSDMFKTFTGYCIQFHIPHKTFHQLNTYIIKYLCGPSSCVCKGRTYAVGILTGRWSWEEYLDPRWRNWQKDSENCNKGLHELYSSPYVIRVSKSS
jgi:hypothetical protein